MSSTYLGGPSDEAAEAQFAEQTHETARLLSVGAQNMLLHIARIRPLPKPFPHEADGRRYLAELLFGELIEAAGEGEFQPTQSGHVVAAALAPTPPLTAEEKK